MKNDQPSAAVHTGVANHKLFLLISVLYIAILLATSAIACYFSYAEKAKELASHMDSTFDLMEAEYSDMVNNFWQLYMPIFEEDDDTYDTFKNYFSAQSAPAELTPMERMALAKSLKKMLLRDNRAQWIALCSDDRSTNYIFFNTNASLQKLTDSFPYLDKIQNKVKQMEIYPMEPIPCADSLMETFAICGGTPPYMGSGKILVGYSVSSFQQICQDADRYLDTFSIQLLNRGRIIYNSAAGNHGAAVDFPSGSYRGLVQSSFTERYFVRSEASVTKDSLLRYEVSWWEIFFRSHKNTPRLLLVILIFILLSLTAYVLTLRYISREVHTIQEGFDYVSANHLDYRLPTNFKQSGLPEIAQSINHMTLRLEENINRAYHYELKQKEAELAELQTKFNPHFLYNSLELLRYKSQQNGDPETADLITQLATIFRGFIGSKTFIPLQEELAFSEHYLALFSARYGDTVEIRYDIDTELLSYGIIRNIFEPLIENYFVHGFNPSSRENTICFSGKSLDDTSMLLIVDDNGMGMSDAELETLNARLHEPILLGSESYGLKNLHQRIKLFYGGDYGLTLSKNGESGLHIVMRVRKLKCSDVEQ